MCQSWDSSFEFEVLLLMLEKKYTTRKPQRVAEIAHEVWIVFVEDKMKEQLENFLE